jgi:hypothetical protein
MNWTAQYRSNGPASFYRTNDHLQLCVITPYKKQKASYISHIGSLLVLFGGG